MPIVNPFENNDAFSMISLTDAINILPNNYGTLRQMGLFTEQGIATRAVMIDIMEGVLNLIPELPVGSPGHKNQQGTRSAKSFVARHFPVDDVLLPDEFDSVRAFGTQDQTTPLIQILNDKLTAMKAKHDITLEYQRWGALKGIVLDASGDTVYNYFTEMGVTQKTVSFALGSSATKVRNKCSEVKRHVEQNLKGEICSGYVCLASASFMDAFTEHDVVKKAYEGYQEAADRLGGDVRSGFTFGGITFKEQVGEATYFDNDTSTTTTRKFVEDGAGYVVPIGTSNTFKTVFAPGDFLETANTIGLPYYAKMEPRKYNRGMDIHTQSNPLSINKRPNLVVKVTAS